LHKSNKTKLAKQLRRNQSEAEEKLWLNLWKRNLNNVKFRRQHPIGSYIVDFVSFEKRVIIEIDGGQHNESPEKEKDLKRTIWLESKGYRVIRFWDDEVLENLEGVLIKIKELLLLAVSPSSHFSLQGRRMALIFIPGLRR
jgi:very-short-patch-repair endonuclease